MRCRVNSATLAPTNYFSNLIRFHLLYSVFDFTNIPLFFFAKKAKREKKAPGVVWCKGGDWRGSRGETV